jgi:hypothetical protein
MANLKIRSDKALDKNGFIQNYPVGTIVIRANSTIDDGWLLCDGRPVNNADYPELLNHLSSQRKILASDRQTSEDFGKSISLSSDGTTLLVGASGETTSPNTFNGAAYVYTRSGGAWVQQQKLLASDAASSDNFGDSVSISSDGNTAIIGAYREDTSPYTDNGAAYVYTRSGGVWTQQQKLVASDAASSEEFGKSVSISSDGNTAIIGTSPASSNANGAAYVFTRSGGVWTQQQKLVASDAAAGDLFGSSVALSPNGNMALVGAYDEDTSPNTGQGAVYVYTRSGGVWTQQQKLVASDAASSENFGYSISISSDGNTALITSYRETTNSIQAGAVYVFTLSGGVWTQQQKLLNSDRESGDFFGISISISSSGNTALIGASGKDIPLLRGAGAAYVFTRSGGVWTQQQKIVSLDAEPSDGFGTSVALSPDGNTAIVGAPFEDTSPNTRNGTIYEYSLGSSLPYGGSSSTFNLPPLVYDATNNPQNDIPFSTLASEPSYPNNFFHTHSLAVNATAFSGFNHAHNTPYQHPSHASSSNNDTNNHAHNSSGNTNTSSSAGGSAGTRAAGPAGPYASGPSGGTGHSHGGAGWSGTSGAAGDTHAHTVNWHSWNLTHNHSHNTTTISSVTHNISPGTSASLPSAQYPPSREVYFLIKA